MAQTDSGPLLPGTPVLVNGHSGKIAPAGAARILGRLIVAFDDGTRRVVDRRHIRRKDTPPAAGAAVRAVKPPPTRPRADALALPQPRQHKMLTGPDVSPKK